MQAQPEIQRAAPIVMGRSNYLSVVLRLIGMDLYKLRRRMLTKILLLIPILLIGGGFFVTGIVAIHDASLPATSFATYSCAQFPHDPNCLDHPPTLADKRRAKQQVLDGLAIYMNMPGNWSAQERFLVERLVVLGIILAGLLVGGEYSLGTVRLMFTRGPTRLQFLFAKVVVLAIVVIPTVLFAILLGSGVGAVMAHLAGVGAGFNFLTADVFGHFVLFVLLGILFWFSYMLMALFFGTVGRSTVVGIVGPLVWLLIEPVLTGFLSSAPGFVQYIPNYLLGNNLLALIYGQMGALGILGRDAATQASAYSAGQPLLVVAAYLIVFVGVACWLTVRRDVTH
ncbi:MAG TPA: ABC transporter permease [Ktedonobacterales bacterium]|jgi:ABC-type transport system involved in multi-copper enzyme maturation permease subunit